MVDKYLIEKTFNNLQIKHGDYFTRIRGVLKKVTDTKEEYNTLRDDIFQFYLESRYRTTERLIMKTMNGKFFSVSDDDEDSVYYTDEMEETTDILYVGHNHPLPNGDSCVQSSSDLYSQVLKLSKYSWTIGKDGFMITKIKDNNHLDENKVIKANGRNLAQYTDKFHKEFEKELAPLKEMYPNWDDPERLDSDRFRFDSEKYLQKFLCNHTQEIVESLNKEFKKDSVAMESYYAKNG